MQKAMQKVLIIIYNNGILHHEVTIKTALKKLLQNSGLKHLVYKSFGGSPSYH